MSHNNNKDGPNNRQSSFMDKVVLWNFRYFWLCPWRRWVAVGHEIITPLALLQTKDSPSAKREEWSHSIEGLILAKTSKISRKFHSWKMNFFSNHVRGPRDQKIPQNIPQKYGFHCRWRACLGRALGKNVPYGCSNCNYANYCRWPPL